VQETFFFKLLFKELQGFVNKPSNYKKQKRNNINTTTKIDLKITKTQNIITEHKIQLKILQNTKTHLQKHDYKTEKTQF
jgi:hypothetical protein